MDTGPSTPASRVIEFLCRHLVATCVTYVECRQLGPTGGAPILRLPGDHTRCSRCWHVSDRWSHTPALGRAPEASRVHVISAVLADTFGSERVTEEPIPFDFVNAPRFYINDARFRISA